MLLVSMATTLLMLSSLEAMCFSGLKNFQQICDVLFVDHLMLIGEVQ